jgi:hypothetical protein
MADIKPILCVVTSHPIRGDSGEPTGFAMVELSHPLEVFDKAGIPVEIASIRGGHPPIDFFDLSDPVNDRYWKDKKFREALAHSLVLRDLDPSRYSAVFFAGGPRHHVGLRGQPGRTEGNPRDLGSGRHRLGGLPRTGSPGERQAFRRKLSGRR